MTVLNGKDPAGAERVDPGSRRKSASVRALSGMLNQGVDGKNRLPSSTTRARHL